MNSTRTLFLAILFLTLFPSLYNSLPHFQTTNHSFLIPFHHPLLSQNLTAKEITVTVKNRCTMYPRCLLFDCCPDILVKSVLESWRNNSRFFTRHFTCLATSTTSAAANPLHTINTTSATTTGSLSSFHGNGDHCHLSSSLTTKLHHLSHWIDWKVKITNDLVDQWLVALPPTPPSLYQQLSRRRREDKRLLYLSMAPRRSALEGCIHEDVVAAGRDFLFLSFKDQEEDALFFPNSIFGYGRLALYAIGRMIELQQGWLYDYFVFIDDDADWGKGNLTSFEEQLKDYEPAIGSPGCYSFPTDQVESNIRIDPIFIAYHREALEVLHPTILDYDRQCGWSSQFLQDMEVSLGYRNHALSFKGMYIYNGMHREYNRNCNYQALIDNMRSALSPTLLHCTVTNAKEATAKQGLYAQGRKVGQPHRKRIKKEEVEVEVEYHYMSKYPKAEEKTRQQHNTNKEHYYSSFYSSFDQRNASCRDVSKFTLEDENCCSLDVLFRTEKGLDY